MSCEEERDLVQCKELYQDNIDCMHKLIQNVSESNDKTLIGRVIGTTAGLASTGFSVAGLAVTALTAPIVVVGSITLAPVLGIIAGGTGVVAATTIFTSKLIKHKMTKAIIREWVVMDGALKKAAKRCEDTLTCVENKLKELQKFGNSPDDSMIYMVYAMKNRMEWKNVELHILSERIREFVLIREMTNRLTINATRKEIISGIQGAANVGGCSIAAAGFALPILDDVIGGTVQLGRNLVPVGRIVAGSVAVAVGVVFNIVDIVDLVNTVTTKDELIEKLESGIRHYAEMVAQINAYLVKFESEE